MESDRAPRGYIAPQSHARLGCKRPCRARSVPSITQPRDLAVRRGNLGLEEGLLGASGLRSVVALHLLRKLLPLSSLLPTPTQGQGSLLAHCRLCCAAELPLPPSPPSRRASSGAHPSVRPTGLCPVSYNKLLRRVSFHDIAGPCCILSFNYSPGGTFLEVLQYYRATEGFV